MAIDARDIKLRNITADAAVPAVGDTLEVVLSKQINRGATIKAFTYNYYYPALILQDYYEMATVITSIILKDIATISYSTDGNTYTAVTVPLTGNLSFSAATWVWWKITFATNKTIGSAYLKIQ